MNAVDAANKAEIAMIHAALNKKFGQLYADIWKVGVNLSLRISDLLTLKYADLNLEERSLKLIEAKTGKLKTIRLNSAAIRVIARRRQEHPSDRCGCFRSIATAPRTTPSVGPRSVAYLKTSGNC